MASWTPIVWPESFDDSTMLDVADNNVNTCVELGEAELRRGPTGSLLLVYRETNLASTTRLIIHGEGIRPDFDRDHCSQLPVVVFTHDSSKGRIAEGKSLLWILNP